MCYRVEKCVLGPKMRFCLVVHTLTRLYVCGFGKLEFKYLVFICMSVQKLSIF